MRWFKHLSTSHEDEILSELLEEFGAEGYGVWWIILEKIALQMDKDDRCSARYSIKKWASSCGVSVKKFQKTVEFLSKVGKFLVENEGKFMSIGCPNLLKFRDEYSRKGKKKSGQCPDNVRSKKQNTETEADKSKPKESPPKSPKGEAQKKIADFQTFYQAYPVKKSKGAAEKAWKKLKPDEDLLQRMLTAIEAQTREKERKRDEGDWVPEWKHPSSWLNQACWEDQVEATEEKAPEIDEETRAAYEKHYRNI